MSIPNIKSASKTKQISGKTYINSEMPEDVLKKVNSREKLYIEAAESIDRIKQTAELEGLSFIIIDGYRLGGSQGDGLLYLQGKKEFTQWAAWELWNNGQPGILGSFNIGPPKYNLAANPTKGFTSNHGYGLSVDIYGNNEKSKKIAKIFEYTDKKSDKIKKVNQDVFQEWLVNNGASFGWIWTGRNFPKIEPWHFDYNPSFDTYSSRKPIEYLIAKSPSAVDAEASKEQLLSNLKTNTTNTITSIFI